MAGIATFIWLIGGFVAGGIVMGWIQQRRLRRSCRRLAEGTDPGTPIGLAGLTEVHESHQGRIDALRREQSLSRRVAEERTARVLRALQGLEDPVIVLDPDGAVAECNDAARRLGSVPVAESERSSIEELVPSRVAAREIVDLAHGLSNAEPGVVRRTTFTLVEEDSEVRDFSVALRRIDDTGRVLVVVHETTREREIVRIKSEFVAKASHELRTPLSSIRATLEMLEEGDLEDADARHEMLGIATEEAGRLARLVDDMLDISRIEAGVARPRIQEVDLGRLSTEVVESLQPVAERRSIELVARRREDDLVVEGDREMLSTVIANLVGNAVKYVPDGERVVVEVSPDDLTRSVVVTVTDTGLGIPAEDLPRIFDKFYRIARYERKARGSGLGLDLCRNIVEEVHQGRIGVDSNLGEGARFWFGVPARHASSLAA
ncbi:MAG: PAS domain-containing protein [Phycisphaera sp.]|nr:PAS domain-containing protein [Phycisphaera sp.]